MRTPTPEPAGPTAVSAFRLTPEDRAALDLVVAHCSSRDGYPVSRTAVLRDLIHQAAKKIQKKER